jgi:hypothetical protein
VSHARIVVNDKVLFDGEPGQWVSRPPEFIADMAEKLKPGALQKPEPHMQAIVLAFGLAMAREADIVIEAATGPGWWTLDVKEL